MAEQEFELLPHQLLEDLKYDVEALKKKLNEPETKSNELILEIETLKDSVHELNTIFKQALDETKEEDIYKSIQILNERIDAVVTQNETIAKGMIAISDKLETFMSKPGPRPTVVTPGAHPAINQSFVSSGSDHMAPPASARPSGMPAPPSIGGGMPPPPPGAAPKKRQGLF